MKERGGGKKYRKIWGGKRRKKQRKTKTEKKVLVFFITDFFGFFDFFFLTKNLEGLEKNHQNFFLNFSSNPKIIMYRKKKMIFFGSNYFFDFLIL